jgi:hypothetical protein
MLQEETKNREPALTPEQKSTLALGYQRLQQEGFCRPKLTESLMGFDWTCFTPRTFAEHAGDHWFRSPPEFLSLAYATLDAYVTAMFATSLKLGDYGEMHFSCRLKQEKFNPRLHLEFETTAERGKVFHRNTMIELLSSLPQLLRMKNIEEDCCYMPGPGARMLIPYPGKLVAERSPFLRHRPCHLWPEVSLNIRPTEALVARAKRLVEFMWNTGKPRGTPN